jgi:hypothetical protein
LVDAEGACVFCRRHDLNGAAERAHAALGAVVAVVRAAAAGNAHPDDIRGCVDHALVTADRGQPLTLVETHEGLRQLHEQGVH